MERIPMRHRFTPPMIFATFAIAAASGAAEADLVRYTFSFEGAVGSLDGVEFVAADASFSLLAEVEDIQPGSPRGFNVTPGSGVVTIDGASVEMASAFVADSAVWTYSDPADGLVIGFGLYVPFENLTVGTYDGPLGWNLATPFSGAAIAGDDVLRDLVDDGITTVAGTFTISSYDSTAIEVVLVPAPGVVGLLASVLVGRRRPTRRRA
ncbi:MAG: hypothetical protein CMJ54_03545 [Planctomycetaceae bacterium]|nr:hypothetical protein [Planctomycetaceae bacterium]